MLLIEILKIIIWPIAVFAMYRHGVRHFGDDLKNLLLRLKQLEKADDTVSASFMTPLNKIESQMNGEADAILDDSSKIKIDLYDGGRKKNPCELICLIWDEVRSQIDEYGNSFINQYSHEHGAVVSLGMLRTKYLLPENEFRALLEMRHMRWNAYKTKINPIYSEDEAARFEKVAEKIILIFENRILDHRATGAIPRFSDNEFNKNPVLRDPLGTYLQ